MSLHLLMTSGKADCLFRSRYFHIDSKDQVLCYVIHVQVLMQPRSCTRIYTYIICSTYVSFTALARGTGAANPAYLWA